MILRQVLLSYISAGRLQGE